jgi:small subunit ribosomal protein S17
MSESSETSTKRVEQTMVGTVLESPMDKTAVVAIEKTAMHQLYRRRFKRTSKLYAHDPGNETRAGDRVLLVASRPLSKTKRWRVKQILQRAEEV